MGQGQRPCLAATESSRIAGGLGETKPSHPRLYLGPKAVRKEFSSVNWKFNSTLFLPILELARPSRSQDKSKIKDYRQLL